MTDRTFTFKMAADEADEVIKGLAMRLNRIAASKTADPRKVGALAGFKSRMEQEYNLQTAVKQAVAMGETKGHA